MAQLPGNPLDVVCVECDSSVGTCCYLEEELVPFHAARVADAAARDIGRSNARAALEVFGSNERRNFDTDEDVLDSYRNNTMETAAAVGADPVQAAGYFDEVVAPLLNEAARVKMPPGDYMREYGFD